MGLHLELIEVALSEASEELRSGAACRCGDCDEGAARIGTDAHGDLVVVDIAAIVFRLSPADLNLRACL